MKFKKGILGLLALAGAFSLVGCMFSGGETTTKAPDPTTTTQTNTDPESTTTTEVVPTFEAYTLEKLHEVRKANNLASLEKKTVIIKGKVTYAKRVDDNADSMFIQSGKYGLEVSYPEPYNVKVGDVVEVKGQFSVYKPGIGDGGINEIKLYTDHSMNSHYDVKVINEAMTVETVTINSKADLIEYDSSLATIDFTVINPSYRTSAFVGKLKEGNEEIIVAPKTRFTENIDTPYEENDKVRYNGVFTFGGNTALVMRFFDKVGLSKITS